MNKPLQFSNHPDADQLSAFAEHILPEHERVATLAHLADCADCRQIVFLAQQAAAPEDPVANAVPRPLPWFRHWNLLWPVAGALACALVTAVILHNTRPMSLPQQARLVEPQMSTPLPQSSSPQPATMLKAPAATKPPSSQNHPRVARRSAPPPAAAPPVIPAVGGQLVSNQTQSNLPLSGRNFQALVPLNGEGVARGSASIHGAVAGAISQPQPAVPQGAPLNQTQGAAVAPLGQNFALRAATQPSASSPLPQSTTQTVDLASAAPAIQTENAALTAGVADAASVTPTQSASSPLPSKLPATIRISNGRETLAIDTAGSLFLSQDVGVRWQQIAQQWPGKVVKIALTPTGSAKQLEAEKSAPPAAMRSAASLGGVSRTPATKRQAFQLTTETGESWISSDGLYWRKK